MKALFITFMTLFSATTQASIICRTPRSNKVFEIKETKITFFSEFDKTADREIASVISKTKSSSTGVTKIVNFENQKHTIHIADSAHFSDVDDYIVIKTKSGHEMTYPLSCEEKK